MKPCILSLGRFANAKLFRLSYAVHRDYTIFRKAVPCRYRSDSRRIHMNITEYCFPQQYLISQDVVRVSAGMIVLIDKSRRIHYLW